MRQAFLPALILLYPGVLGAQAMPPQEAAALLKRARAAHYNAADQGFGGLEADVVPEWDTVLAALRKQDAPAADRAMRILESLHFHMVMGADGVPKVTHDDPQAANPQSAQGLAQVYGGMEQMLHGFFQSWGAFELNHPFPDPGVPFVIQAAGGQHVITYKEGDTDIETTLGPDLRILSIKVHSPALDSLVQPQFEASPQGFYLVGYQGDYSDGKPEETTRLHVRIDTQMAAGVRVPSRLVLVGSYGATLFNLEVGFTDLKVTRK
ncbi:MAG TPA: hypothetical protein VFT46_01945 [Holophagaceae bacterium]|nr:hypothetical protein [Holophagaceae bacterium]